MIYVLRPPRPQVKHAPHNCRVVPSFSSEQLLLRDFGDNNVPQKDRQSCRKQQHSVNSHL
eukprot:COSAG02_NODE_1553_length_11961_cov_5.094335_8_plen_60_part_00